MAEEVNSLILNVQSDTVTKASERLKTFARDGENAERSVVGLSGQSTKTGNSLKSISDGGNRASKSLTDVSRESVKADKSLTTVSRAADSAKRSLQGMIVGAVGIAAISAGIGAATREWLSYDKAIKEVNSITTQTAGEFKAMRKDVLQLSVALGVDATKAAKGLYQALSAGVPKENAIAFMEIASKAAIAGVTDVNVAVDGLTNTINAFKIPVSEAESVADKLFSTVVQGKTTFEELSQNMSKASVPAASLGIDLNELLGVIVGITKQGTPTSEAFTQVKATIQALNDPAKEMVAVFKEMGVATGREAIAKFGLVETLNRLETAYRGNDVALVKALRSSEAFNGVLSVTGTNLEGVRTAVDGVKNSTGQMGGAFKENANTLENSLTSLKAASVLLVEQMEGSFGIIEGFTLRLKEVANILGGGQISVDTDTILKNPQQTFQNLDDINSRLTTLKNNLVEQKSAVEAYNNSLGNKLGLYENNPFAKLSGADGDVARSTKEIGLLQQAYSGVTEELRLQYETQERIAEVRSRKGVDQESVLEYERFQNEELIKQLVTRREQIELEATQSLARAKESEQVQARGKAAGEQLAKDKKLAEEKAKAEKEAAAAEEKRIKSLIENGKDLITTDKERIELKIADYDLALKNGQIDSEFHTKVKAQLLEEIKLLEARNATNTGGSKPGILSNAPNLSPSSAIGYGGGSFQSLPEINDPFSSRNELEELDRQTQEITQSYEERKLAILSITSATEEEKLSLLAESEAKYSEIMDKAERERNTIRLNLAADFFGNLSQVASAFGKKGAKIAKAAAITQTIIKTYESATSAYASLAGIPYIGPALGAAAAAAAVAAGFANVQAIRSQPVDAGAYATGGIVGGNNRAGDNLQARVNSGEMILNLGQQQKLFNIANGKESSNGNQSSQPIINVNVKTLPGTTAEVKQNPNDPQQLEIIIRKVEDALTSNLQTGGGKFIPALTKKIPSLKQPA